MRCAICAPLIANSASPSASAIASARSGGRKRARQGCPAASASRLAHRLREHRYAEQVEELKQTHVTHAHRLHDR